MNLFKVKNPWPVGLVIFFIVFISYIVGFVIFSTAQHMDLVREDYYDQEIRFQQQIDRVQRTTPILAAASVDYDVNRAVVMVRLPSSIAAQPVSGTINFYRPSDAGLDHDISLAPDPTGAQSVNVRDLRTGLWKVRVQWKTGSQDYFFERRVIIKHGERS